MQGETLSSNTETISLPSYGDEAINYSSSKEDVVKVAEDDGRKNETFDSLGERPHKG